MKSSLSPIFTFLKVPLIWLIQLHSLEKNLQPQSYRSRVLCSTFDSTRPPSLAFSLQKPHTKRIHPAHESARAAFPRAPLPCAAWGPAR